MVAFTTFLVDVMGFGYQRILNTLSSLYVFRRGCVLVCPSFVLPLVYIINVAKDTRPLPHFMGNHQRKVEVIILPLYQS